MTKMGTGIFVWKVSIESPRGPQKYIKSYETIYIYHIGLSLSYLYGIIYQHNECVRVLLHGTITTFIKSAIPLSNLYDASWKVMVALKNASEKCNLEHIEFQIFPFKCVLLYVVLQVLAILLNDKHA